MRIKKGDKVRFLNDVGSGIVVGMPEQGMVNVRTKDGWDMPYPVSELIVIPDDPRLDPYKPESDPQVDASRSSHKEKNKPDEWQAFLLVAKNSNEDDGSSRWDFYVVNDSPADIYFSFYFERISSIDLVDSNLLESGTKIKVITLDYSDFSTINAFLVQGIIKAESLAYIPPLINYRLAYQAKKFNADGAFKENDYVHEPGMLCEITKPDIEKNHLTQETIREQIHEKEIVNRELNATKQFESGKAPFEQKSVDLHINQLVDSVVGMSNHEILKVQMAVFHENLNRAIKDNERSIVFIHGIGNGTLKTELRKAVDREYPVCSHEDASFQEFGFGATLIRIRQNK